MEGHKWLGKAFKWPTEPRQNHTITICVYFFKSFQCVRSECTHWNDLKMEPVSRYNLKTNLGILLSYNRVVISYKIPIMPSKCIQIFQLHAKTEAFWCVKYMQCWHGQEMWSREGNYESCKKVAGNVYGVDSITRTSVWKQFMGFFVGWSAGS